MAWDPCSILGPWKTLWISLTEENMVIVIRKKVKRNLLVNKGTNKISSLPSQMLSVFKKYSRPPKNFENIDY